MVAFTGGVLEPARVGQRSPGRSAPEGVHRYGTVEIRGTFVNLMTFISNMNAVDFRSIDLNLLVVFKAIKEEGSLTRAGQRLGLTQPAVSHALRRLRVLFNDPLFVRLQVGVQPTAVADQLAAPIDQALALIESSLSWRDEFDPRTANRRFKISMSDIGEFVYVPPLLDRISREAPSVDLEVVAVEMPRLTDALRVGEIDLAIGYLPGLRASTMHEPIFRDRHICIVRADHPMRARSMSIDAFSRLAHVSVTSTSSGHRMVEELLLEQQIRRRVALRLPHLTAIPEVIQRTDLAATLPHAVARIFAERGRFRIYEHPAKLPPIEVTAHWHARFNGDPANCWLRRLVVDVLREAVPSDP